LVYPAPGLTTLNDKVPPAPTFAVITAPVPMCPLSVTATETGYF